MKPVYITFLAALVFLPGAIAKADSVPDPQIIINGGSSSVPIEGLHFGFTPGPSEACTGKFGEGFNCFEGVNESPADWFNLELTIQLPEDPDIVLTCSSNLFAHNTCGSPTFLSDSKIGVLFFGLDETHPGIPTEFFIDPATSHFIVGVNGFPGGTTFSGSANIPEPGTLTLLLTGIAALGARRRLSKRSRSGA